MDEYAEKFPCIVPLKDCIQETMETGIPIDIMFHLNPMKNGQRFTQILKTEDQLVCLHHSLKPSVFNKLAARAWHTDENIEVYHHDSPVLISRRY